MKVKKIMAAIAVTTTLGLAGLSMTACGGESTITRYTRDTESGTREGFFEKIGFKEAQKDNEVLPGAVEVSSNGTMLSSVMGDEFGIGYVSLASASSDVKVLNFNGVEATEENVNNGTYKLSRNFNYITRCEEDMSDAEKNLVEGFLLYMQSKEGLTIITASDGIIPSDAIEKAESWDTIIDKEENTAIKTLCNSTVKTTIYLGGSTSVEKMSKALTAAFSNECAAFEAVHNHTGSGDAYKRTQGSDKDSQNKLHIGFLSRDVKTSSDEAAASGTYGKICVDGIAVIVNKANDRVSNLTEEQLKKIYSTEGITWSEVIEG